MSEKPEEDVKIKQPPILFDRTQKIVQALEEELGGRFLSYWSNPRGNVCHSDVVAFYELLEECGPQEKIFLFIKSDGGSGQASLRIVNLLRKYCGELIALVPLECASAATMMAIGADEIRMGPMAYLTAVDTSLTHDLSPIDRDNDRVSVSLNELSRVVRLWRGEQGEAGMNPYHALFEHVHPLVIGAVDRAESLSVMLCKEILSHHIRDEEKADEIAHVLNSKYPSHSYPILLEEAKKIGLDVSPMSASVHRMLLDLNELYSEMGQKATTDFDERNAHGNEILNILERPECVVYYQQDKDWFYRAEERRWISLNDNSSWRKIRLVDGQEIQSVLHIS
ncbi:MAG: ATP-dependent Clp protease proteolytic subunit [Planctomycetes bacterium]|nr:ATP-dependent Clp protease proteolytic subunit [Planctomycetota bacterium]MCB9891826.1 ATP-dependent Clp protease proteolytic subunit [Planctomycetota bacterium]